MIYGQRWDDDLEEDAIYPVEGFLQMFDWGGYRLELQDKDREEKVYGEGIREKGE